jgi:hypothetical protein
LIDPNEKDTFPASAAFPAKNILTEPSPEGVEVSKLESDT